MLIIAPGKTSVHDIRSDKRLWENKHDDSLDPAGTASERELRMFGYRTRHWYGIYSVRCYDPFINSQITGYVYKTRDMKDTLKIYDTDTGNLIASHANERIADLVTRGPLICYAAEGLHFNVIKVVDKKMKEYSVSFAGSPIKEVAQDLMGCKEYSVNLVGFLAKTNVVIGYLRHLKAQSVFFSLDLDAAISARDEKDAWNALSLFPVREDSDGWIGQWCEAVYRADRDSKSLDLVGVMRKKKDERCRVVAAEAYIFVTELQFPTQDSDAF